MDVNNVHVLSNIKGMLKLAESELIYYLYTAVDNCTSREDARYIRH